MTNEQLLHWARQCQQADATAQRQLYAHTYNWMLGIGKRYLQDWHTLEDVLSMAYVKIYQHLPNIALQEAVSLRAWMKRILINECLMELRKNTRTAYDEEAITDIPITDNALNQMTLKEIMQGVEQLPIGYRTVFNLYVLDQWTHKEIAEMLGISEQTSKSQLHKAKKQLQELLKHLYHG